MYVFSFAFDRQRLCVTHTSSKLQVSSLGLGLDVNKLELLELRKRFTKASSAVRIGIGPRGNVFETVSKMS